jgi:hypothetical protein
MEIGGFFLPRISTAAGTPGTAASGRGRLRRLGAEDGGGETEDGRRRRPGSGAGASRGFAQGAAAGGDTGGPVGERGVCGVGGEEGIL